MDLFLHDNQEVIKIMKTKQKASQEQKDVFLI